ncbi:MAG: hypothetical protein HOV87_34390 [Catenulispora sp.]|nr:hypothetical protein [Catenulispora sp.]
MFWIGLVLWVLVGGELGAIAHGAFQLGGDGGAGVAELVIGINAFPWTGLVAGGLLASGRRKRHGLGALDAAAGPTVSAAARIESSRAVGEGPNFPVRLDLTVAPADRPSFRVDARDAVNLMDLHRLQPGRTVVVDYDPRRPWQVSVRSDPGAEWVERIALAAIDTAPEESRVRKPAVPGSRWTKWYVLAATAVGFGLWWVLV